MQQVIPVHLPDFTLVQASFGAEDVTSKIAKLPQGGWVVHPGMWGLPASSKGPFLVDWTTGSLSAAVGDFVIFGEPPAAAITFVIKARNEAATLREALMSLHLFSDPYHVLVVLHRCTDPSKQIVDAYTKEDKPTRVQLTVVEYEEPVSRAGIECFVTEASHPRSLASYYGFCRNQTHTPWLFKWDADFIMTPALAEFLHQRRLQVSDPPTRIGIYTLSSDEKTRGCEPYLTNALDGYTKFMFWEIPTFRAGSKAEKAPPTALIRHDDNPTKTRKSYWDEPAWYFDGSDPLLLKRHQYVENVLLKDVPHERDFARHGNPLCALIQRRLNNISITEIDKALGLDRMPPRVCVLLKGRLGNQLFQIAAGFAFAQEKKQKLSIHGGSTVWQLTCPKCLPFVGFEIPRNVTWYREPCFHFKPIPRGAQALDGYFQSSKFFRKYSKEIRALFTMPPSPERLPPSILQTACAIHVRRGDYLKLPLYHTNLDSEYFQPAIQHMKVTGGVQNFFVFSDDPEWCQKKAPFLKGSEFQIVAEPNEMKALQFMSTFPRIIISNSSYSWWGAWLGAPKATVIAPSQWFGPKGPQDWQDIYEPNWLKF